MRYVFLWWMITILLFSWAGSGFSQPAANELPIGCYVQNSYTFGYNQSQIMTMHDTLGFNFINPTPWTWTTSIKNKMMDFAAEGIKCIPVGGGEDYHKYSWSHYMKVEAENDTSEVRFRWKHGNGEQDGDYWVIGPEDDIVLDSLYYNSAHNRGRFDQEFTDYYTFLKFKVGQDDAVGFDTIAYLIVDAVGSWELDAFANLDTFVISGDFTPGEDTVYECGFYNFDGNTNVSKPIFKLLSADYCSLYVDYIKVYDDWGFGLIEDPNTPYVSGILDFVDPLQIPGLTAV